MNYIILNFYYNNEEQKWYNRTDTNIYLNIKYNSISEIESIKYIQNEKGFDIIIDVDIDNLKDEYKNFYKLMCQSDSALICYRDNETYYIKLSSYSLEFKMYNEKIYYNFEQKDYEVSFMNESNLFNIYGILKLTHANKVKYLLIYNYVNIVSKLNTNVPDKFANLIKLIDEAEKEIYKKEDLINTQNLKKENKDFINNFYAIVDFYEDNLILKDKQDLLALLSNCIIYNNPQLIMKTIKQIQTIILNSDIDAKFIYTLVSMNYDIYSLIIYQLILNTKQLNNYNYSYFYKLLEKYNYFFEIKKPAISYLKQININFKKKDNINYDHLIILSDNISIDDINSSYFIVFENKFGNVAQCKLEVKEYNVSGDDNYTIKYPDNINNQLINLLTIGKFSLLLKNNIGSILNQSTLTDNINKTQELYRYLIINDKEYLYPIQELIMGSGKSSTITPLLCLLLVNYLILNKKYDSSIYVIMPSFLIQQSFETFMKNLLPVNNFVEIIVNDSSSLFDNSIKIYLMSDTKYKENFLTKNYNTENMYMIYDEVDLIANPLTSELNMPIPESKKDLLNHVIIYELTKLLYEKIFVSDDFWKTIKEINNNGIHNYIFINIDKDLKQQIYEYFENIINNENNEFNFIVNYPKLVEYFKLNILEYILTNQFNFNYGIPENYGEEIKNENYKFKAIPYAGGDNPLYGSEFSDIILSLVTTYFSYRLKGNKLRKIDRIKIIEKLQEGKLFEKLKICFSTEITSINNFEIYKQQYLLNIKDEFNGLDNYIETYIKNILNNNIKYYEETNNISFTDLMLNKNIKNYIGFTGTSYLELPEEENIQYLNNEKINYSKILEYPNVEEAIKNILLNKTKFNKFYISHTTNEIISDIFSSISDYDVLIDIGAIFINYTNEQFVEEYSNLASKKKYLVYFDNGIKVYNNELKAFTSKLKINKGEKNTLFYFSNKNITGVDAKSIMNLNAKGLVTISNKTILRDFSQGIFRMRNILDGKQSFDIILNRLLVKNKNDECEIQRGGEFDDFDCYDGEKLFNLLKSNQEKTDSCKKKVLTKQNIMGLLKDNLVNDAKQYLYIDPSVNNQNVTWNGEKRTNDIDNINIINKYDNKNSFQLINIFSFANNYVKLLIDKYFDFESSSITTNTNLSIETEVETEVEKEVVVQTIISNIIKDKEIKYQTTNVYLERIKEPMNIEEFNNSLVLLDIFKIVFYISTELKNIFIIYEHGKNNIFIADNTVFDTFLSFADEDKLKQKYTLISLKNKFIYGYNEINEEFQNKIECNRIFIKEFIIDFWSDVQEKPDYSLTFDDMEFIKKNKDLYLEISNSFKKNIYFNNNGSSFGGESNFYKIKYLKYKSKYLNLCKNSCK